MVGTVVRIGPACLCPGCNSKIDSLFVTKMLAVALLPHGDLLCGMGDEAGGVDGSGQGAWALASLLLLLLRRLRQLRLQLPNQLQLPQLLPRMWQLLGVPETTFSFLLLRVEA